MFIQTKQRKFPCLNYTFREELILLLVTEKTEANEEPEANHNKEPVENTSSIYENPAAKNLYTTIELEEPIAVM